MGLPLAHIQNHAWSCKVDMCCVVLFLSVDAIWHNLQHTYSCTHAMKCIAPLDCLCLCSMDAHWLSAYLALNEATQLTKGRKGQGANLVDGR